MPENRWIVFCRSLPQATEDVKWGHDLVFSVGGKMFAAFDLTDTRRCSFKTTPDDFAVLTALPGIRPAPYAARFHWVSLDSARVMAAADLRTRLRRSYSLVAGGLPNRLRASLGLGGAAGKGEGASRNTPAGERNMAARRISAGSKRRAPGRPVNRRLR